MESTVWTLIPPVLAIALALATKEVYFSLFIGICAGALMYTGFHPGEALNTTVELISTKVQGNICIIIFLIMLGMLVSAMAKSGASKAYGEWARRNIKTKRGSLFATMGLGILIFIDDYFNCLTVGTIMSPITDRNKVTRAKLAYIIDATAAPICIIAPVSSWAAAVSSSLPENSSLDGFQLFINAIPYNYYALLTILMLVLLIAWDFDFSKMKKYEERYGTEVTNTEKSEGGYKVYGNGTVADLLIPIVALIIFCVASMLYTGGFFAGEAGIVDAFANCDAALSLVIGSFAAMILTAFLYIPRKILSFRVFMESLVEGFKAMVPAILILTFAWTLGGICSDSYLNLGGYVSGVINSVPISMGVIPFVFFLVALGLAFATGTSWGTFAILLPIVFTIFNNEPSTLLIISMAAVMGGAVNGDHISPISDTTILSSTGAGCNHIEHVQTQMPYALLVSCVCIVSYIVAGFTDNGWLGLLVGVILMPIVLFIIKKRVKG